MRPTVSTPLKIRGSEFGGPRSLFCIPIVAAERAELLSQAEIAHSLQPDVVEWRADYSADWSPAGLERAANALRGVLPDEPIIFTLRIRNEGGAQAMGQPERRASIETVLRSGMVDLVDLELANEPEFLDPLMALAKERQVRVILAFHDFQGTPSNESLLERISTMHAKGADIAKIAVMPKDPGDVLRVLQVTAEARRIFPSLPLAIMSMGSLGVISRVAGFLYGSDMAFAVGKESSAPGQIPIKDARLLAETLLRYA